MRLLTSARFIPVILGCSSIAPDAAGAGKVVADIKATFPEVVPLDYVPQFALLPGESQVATFSLPGPGILTVTAEFNPWRIVAFGQFGVTWKPPGSGSWSDIPPWGETLFEKCTSQGKEIKKMDDAKDAPLKVVWRYRVKEKVSGMEVSMQRPFYFEGSFCQRSQSSRMVARFTREA